MSNSTVFGSYKQLKSLEVWVTFHHKYGASFTSKLMGSLQFVVKHFNDP